jgi:calcium binding protein 39
MNFFRTKQRTPSELVRALKDAIVKLDATTPGGDTRRKVGVFPLLETLRMLTSGMILMLLII